MKHIILFKNTDAALNAAYLLRSEWDGLNGVAVKKVNIDAIESVANQVQSEYCFEKVSCRLPGTTEMLLILYAKKLRDFQFVDLSFKDLSKAKLAESNFRNANLSHTNLRNVDLRNADLSYANLKNADLRNANLSHAQLYDAYLAGADFSGADLTKACLQEANFEGTNLSDAKLKSANLKYSILAKVNLNGANFYNACLVDASLIGIDRTCLKGARLRDDRDIKMSTPTTLFRLMMDATILLVFMFTLCVGLSITIGGFLAWFNSEHRAKPETSQSKLETRKLLK